MTDNTGLESLCLTGDTAESLKAHVESAMGSPFTEKDIEIRKKILDEQFSNMKNAELLSGKIFG